MRYFDLLPLDPTRKGLKDGVGASDLLSLILEAGSGFLAGVLFHELEGFIDVLIPNLTDRVLIVVVSVFAHKLRV